MKGSILQEKGENPTIGWDFEVCVSFGDDIMKSRDIREID